ncbi:uncharacterized protein (DUF58 family) [Bradyrhizobium sp. i1.3.1]
MRWFLFNVIGTSIGLGMLLITVFDNWMRGYSIFWWVMLALLTMLSILINALMLVVRIKRSSAIATPVAAQESASPTQERSLQQGRSSRSHTKEPQLSLMA